jgi:hypothetical protein
MQGVSDDSGGLAGINSNFETLTLKGKYLFSSMIAEPLCEQPLHAGSYLDSDSGSEVKTSIYA